MIGNDIISLAEVLPHQQALRPGFCDKVCLPEELQPLTTYFSREICIWALWAAKESAYKVYRQAGGSALFAPKKNTFLLHSIHNSQLKGITTTPNGRYHSRILLQTEYIMAESWSANFDQYQIAHKVMAIPNKPYALQSASLKEKVMDWVAQNLGMHAESLSISKSSIGMPYLKLGNKRLDLSLSLSHHGHFGLCSIWVKKNSPFLG